MATHAITKSMRVAAATFPVLIFFLFVSLPLNNCIFCVDDGATVLEQERTCRAARML